MRAPARAFTGVMGALAAAGMLWGARATFDLEGRIEPPRARVLVTLDGARSPFTVSVFTDSKGRFRIRRLETGPYSLVAFVPGFEEVRQTVEIGAGLARKDGRIEVVVRFEPEKSAGAARRAHTISARELSIPDAARREFREAQALLGRREVEAAIRRLERAVEIAPQFVEAWNNLGTIAYQSRRYEDAERYFRTALDHEPGAYAPAVNLGGVLLTLGRYQEALEYNLFAVAQEKREALANAQLGMNYYYLQRPEPALKYLQEAKRLDPNHFSYPQRYLALIYAQRGNASAAAAELEDLLKRHPDDPAAPLFAQTVEKLRAR